MRSSPHLGMFQDVSLEAGCFKGSSTAKFSLAARAAGRELVVFGSFEGIPPHEEAHSTNIFGKPVSFPTGSYCGQLDEVDSNVPRFGARERSAGWSRDGLMRQCPFPRASCGRVSRCRFSVFDSHVH